MLIRLSKKSNNIHGKCNTQIIPVVFIIPLLKKHHGGFHMHGIMIDKQIIPHGRIPMKVPTNHIYIYIHVSNNNFTPSKRFQVAPTKQGFLSALTEQQGPLLLCTC